MKEIRDQARELMTGFCRVCPVCNGRACIGEVPGMGGVGSGSSFMANVESLAAHKFNMRLIHDVQEPDTRVEFLGMQLALPVLAAPIGGVAFNMGGRVSEEDYITAVMTGCREAGTIGGGGDGVPDVIHQAANSAIKALSGHGIPFIKPWEDDELYQKMELAEATGAAMMGMDIDAAGLVTLKKMGRPVSPKNTAQLKKIISRTKLPFILKGIMTPDQAKRAVNAGAKAIVVSNHGGRVLDHTPGVAAVLKEVATAVQGQVAVLADGGVRSGGDVLKMLALGANAVMIGRPITVAAMGGGAAGVKAFLEQIKGELVQTMVLTGTRRAARADPSILFGSRYKGD